MTPYLLAVFALALIFLEFYMPGGILGILGGIALLASYFVLISEGADPLEILLFIGGSLLALALVIKYALWRIPRSKKGIYLSGDQEGFVSATYDKSAIGKQAVVMTDLKPGGFIQLEGKSHPAISLTGYIEKGKTVKIVSGEGESLLVKLKD
jgi:membrane-bound serine protease (ClpP class)